MRVLPLLLLSASALTFTATAAVAEPSYSTVGCIPSGAPNASVRHNMNFVFNESTATAAPVLCPIVKHERNENKFIFGSTVQVIDRDTDDEVRCTLASMTRTGSAGGFPFEAVGSGDNFADSASKELDLPIVHSFVRGFYVLSCSIPKKTADNERSGIVTYNISEVPLPF